MMNLFSKEDKKERVAIYIDGSNFYGYLKNEAIGFPKGVKFDFKGFADFLVGDKRECISKRYYTGVFRNLDGSPKSESLVHGHNKNSFQNLKMTVLKSNEAGLCQSVKLTKRRGLM